MAHTFLILKTAVGETTLVENVGGYKGTIQTPALK